MVQRILYPVLAPGQGVRVVDRQDESTRMLRAPALGALAGRKEVDEMTECSQDVLLGLRGIRKKEGHLCIRGLDALHPFGRHREADPVARIRGYRVDLCRPAEQLRQEESVPGAPSGECPSTDRKPVRARI